MYWTFHKHSYYNLVHIDNNISCYWCALTINLTDLLVGDNGTYRYPNPRILPWRSEWVLLFGWHSFFQVTSRPEWVHRNRRSLGSKNTKVNRTLGLRHTYFVRGGMNKVNDPSLLRYSYLVLWVCTPDPFSYFCFFLKKTHETLSVTLSKINQSQTNRKKYSTHSFWLFSLHSVTEVFPPTLVNVFYSQISVRVGWMKG